MKRIIFILILCVLFSFISFAQTKEAQKLVDLEHSYTCDDFIIISQNFFTKLDKMPNAMPYLIVYEGKRDNKRFPLPMKGELEGRMRIMKRRMEDMSGKKVNFIYGGFREMHKLEFWIVPEGAEPPKPEPTLKKIKYSKRKYRKNSLNQFCSNF